MNIQKINLLPLKPNFIKPNQRNNNTNPIQEDKNLPIYAYRDYNISFSGGRTPEDFYRQEFNVKGMPESMKNYLYDDFEDRQFMPPAQIMRTVFEDVNKLDKLDDVKRLYSDEPLFQTIHDKPSIQSRTIKEIDLMSDGEMRPFKTSNDTLGMYLLKKIYIEGKTLDEINKAFEKDLSIHYKGVSPIDYNTLRAYGIYFPNKSFWHSFIATREDYTINHKPRKALESRIKSSNFERTSSAQKTEKPKFDVSDRDVNDITDAIVKSRGNKTETSKQMRRKGVKEQDSKLHFIQRYLGEIMSVALEKAHASDEMRNFFEDYENLPKNQKEKLEAYWKRNPSMREAQSQAISDTIKLFFLTYGADGNNEDFQELLEYANSIKPEREERLRRHEELQAEYEKELGVFDTEDNIETEHKDSAVEADEIVEKSGYEYNINDISIKLKSSVEDMIRENYRIQMGDYLPAPYLNKFTEFLLEHPNADHQLLFSILLNLNKNNASEKLMNTLYTIKETLDKVHIIKKDFMRQNVSDTRAAQQSVISALCYSLSDKNDKKDLELLYNTYPLNYAYRLELDDNELEKMKPFMAKFYNLYKKPVTTTEAVKITSKMTELLRNYDIKRSGLSEVNDSTPEIENMLVLCSLFKIPKNEGHKYFKDRFTRFLTLGYGGSARALLDDRLPLNVRNGLMEDMLLTFVRADRNTFNNFVVMANLNKI